MQSLLIPKVLLQDIIDFTMVELLRFPVIYTLTLYLFLKVL